jgi:hypothetical protein
LNTPPPPPKERTKLGVIIDINFLYDGHFSTSNLPFQQSIPMKFHGSCQVLFLNNH